MRTRATLSGETMSRLSPLHNVCSTFDALNMVTLFAISSLDVRRHILEVPVWDLALAIVSATADDDRSISSPASLLDRDW